MSLNKKESFGIIGRLKKFNELFDTEDIKSKLEIPILQGLLDVKKLASTPTGIETDSQFTILHDKLSQFHPFLEQCLMSTDPELCGAGKDENGSFKYYFSDRNWFVSITIDKEAKGSFVASIMYKKCGLDITEENIIVNRGTYTTEYNPSKVVVELYEDLPFEELINGVIGISLKDVLIDLGLGSFLNNPFTQELKQTYEN